MLRNLFYLVIIISVYQILFSCANPQSLTGGPRDTIPPIRLFTEPENQSIHFKGKNILLQFDERIKTDKIKEQLIITPYIDFKYDYTIKKNTLKISFNGTFQDSTTYTLNFRESIQDLTEGNPTKDNKFTFSTGDYIDSMSIDGYVKDLLTYDTLENVIVGLYPVDDTITIFNGPPYYFTELNEKGKYEIENIKNGLYKLYAFKDENKNLTLQPKDEAYAFFKDTIMLDTGKISQNLDLIRLDFTDLKLLTALPSGQYYDINFNKPIYKYTTTPIDTTKIIYSGYAKKNKSIRIYNDISVQDSLAIKFTAIDSIDNRISDTVYVKFTPTKRKKEELKINILPKRNAAIKPQTTFNIEFNKPVKFTNCDSIFIQFDTTKLFQIHDTLLHWNKLKTKLSFLINLDKTKADTVLAIRNKMQKLQADSTKKEKQIQSSKQQINTNKKVENSPLNKGLQLYIGKASFVTADLDTAKTITANYKFLVPENFGTQSVKIETDYRSFILQLVTEKFEIYRQIKNTKSVTFDNVEPGNYKIRVLIDRDNDGRWSPGNIIQNIPPEPVYIYPETLVIRAEWETSLDISF